MRVELKKLKPNPLRDFAVDPIDQDHVDRLALSIGESGFWGGVCCRQRPDGEIEIGAGHHRVQAAIQAGIESAELHVANGSMDEAAMVRVYAVETSTQRGSTGTAVAGIVAAAIRYLAKAILTGAENVSGILETSERGLETIRGQLTSEKGLGQSVIVQFLDGVPGINNNTVMQALANLKASGDYARIVREVQQEIEALPDEPEPEPEPEPSPAPQAAGKRAPKPKKKSAPRKPKEDARKAAAAAAKRDRTFDFVGVSKHLKNAHQIDVFREVVTGPTVAPFLPVENQAALAEELVRLAGESGIKLTCNFIRTQILSGRVFGERAVPKITAEMSPAFNRTHRVWRMTGLQAKFAATSSSLSREGTELMDAIRAWPADESFEINHEFQESIGSVKSVIDELRKALRLDGA
jgi:hypothetical protein